MKETAASILNNHRDYPTLGCGKGERSPDALASALRPQFEPEYYVDQANKYFDTLDTSANPNNVPAYSDLVARWELPPWLWLTGYERENIIQTTEFAVVLKESLNSTRSRLSSVFRSAVRALLRRVRVRGGPVPDLRRVRVQ